MKSKTKPTKKYPVIWVVEFPVLIYLDKNKNPIIEVKLNSDTEFFLDLKK